MSNIHKGLMRLKHIIDNTSTDSLSALKDSIAISDLHPQIKEACFADIELKQNGVQSAIIEHSEVKMGEL